jgi:uncharacterized Zn finger protein
VKIKLTEDISLAEFRKILPEQYLERGWYYWKNGWVKIDLKPTGGFCEAVIEDAETHTVLFLLNEEVVSEYFCTCTCKFGKPCRHLAAVLFALENGNKDFGFTD